MTAAPDGSPESWAASMREEEEATASKYRRNPKRLIADHHNEQSITRDYVGREILELLQNAKAVYVPADDLTGPAPANTLMTRQSKPEN